MRTILLLICICTTSVIFAQKECATSSYLESEKISNPNLAKKLAELEGFIQKHTSSIQKQSTLLSTEQNLKTTPTVIRIPVVVHVIYYNEAQNISDKQIQSQIDVLNQDFRRKNADAANTPDQFKPVAADVQIEFYLAKTDPNGKATNGVVRKKTSVANWMANDKIKFSKQGGNDAWDSKSYLNIWVGNLRGSLGYASAPGSDPTKDGMVINYTAFGTINTAAPYHLGRTAVHEVGHWLGLKHIWGDAHCGDDLVSDTPFQGSFTTGCPNGFRSTCSNGTVGDMYMNFMDFTNDACLNMFTEGQKSRMRAMFKDGGPRASMLTSKGLNEPVAITEAAELPQLEVKQISIFPNPATDAITVSFNNDGNWIGRKLQILSGSAAVLQEIKITAQSQKVSLTSLKPGVYFINAENGHGSRYLQKVVKL